MTNRLNPKQRVQIPRQHPQEPAADARVRDFREVSPGLDEPHALLEALRCLECRDPVCTRGCPVNIDIRAFVRQIVHCDYAGAAATIREKNPLAAITGRVCPQESQCECSCTMGRRFAPIAIGLLERFVSDQERLTTSAPLPRPHDRAGRRRVAIVGSGPAGLTCAADLARLGHEVTVFEALHALGGVLRYGIPEFRLPKTILDRQIDELRAMGIAFVTNFLVGRTASIDELFDEWMFDAVFLGTGAGTPTFLGLPGEGLNGVYSANEFLTRVNLMSACRSANADTPVHVSRRVAVIGGGNTALDAVRTARRLGAETAYLVYRRSRAEMPARAEEVRHASEEGVDIRFLTHPTRILGDDDGWVRGLEVVDMALGDADESGRPRPRPIPGSEHVLEVETIIEAVGQKPNPIIQQTTPGLAVDRRGVVVADAGQRTNRPGVFVGGDLSRGGATVILAMADGQRAAASIHEYLAGR